MHTQSSLFRFPIDFVCFGSGSSGNCYYLRHGDYGLLIDMGVGIRKFQKYFNSYGFKLPQVKGVLLTHDHLDHVRAAGAMSTKMHWPVYATSLVHEGIRRNPVIKRKITQENAREIVHGTAFDIGPFHTEPFKVPHDASDNTGYFISCNDTNICIITDAGHITPIMKEYIAKAEHLVIESNYDAEMLRTGPYPFQLQERIRNGSGHLSNDICAATLRDCVDPARLKRLWLCHLSQENNTPQKALETTSAALSGLNLSCTPEPLRRIEVSGPFSLI